MLTASLGIMLGVTEVLFSFDTEDFTSPASAEGIKELAELMTEEGVTAHFVTVGYLARALRDWGRDDIVKAMEPHLKLFHTRDHSIHPNVLEMSDVADYTEIYPKVLAREAEGLRMLRDYLGVKEAWGTVPPGNSDSYVSYYAYAELGLKIRGGSWFTDFTKGEDWWFCNLRQIPYLYTWEEFLPPAKFDPDAFLDKLATCKRTFVFCHPNMVHSLEFWDVLNYKYDNLVPHGKWRMSAERDSKDVTEYLGRIRTLVRRIKADPRFRITTVAELSQNEKPRVAITRADVSKIRRCLSTKFAAIDDPSWSLSDCFVAMVKFLRGETRHLPVMAYGFLERPCGVSESTAVSATALREAARKIDVSSFLPAQIRVGDKDIGPADFLMAALEMLDTGAENVVVQPKEQLGGFGPFPMLENLCFKDTWLHSRTMRDDYLSDRLRWQIWTLRHE